MKMHIYILDKKKLENKSESSEEYADYLDYLVDLNESNISFNASDNTKSRGTIYISEKNLPASVFSGVSSIPGFVFSRECEVYYDNNYERYFVSVRSNYDSTPTHLYIKKHLNQGNPIYSSSVYTFDVNPDSVTPNYSKLNTETRTRGGWNVQFWGNDIPVISFTGKSKCLIPKNSKSREGMDITASNAWKNIADLRNIYVASKRELGNTITFGINYFDTFYIGYFTDFQGPTQDADSPFQITYAFKFKVTREISLADSISLIDKGSSVFSELKTETGNILS